MVQHPLQEAPCHSSSLSPEPPPDARERFRAFACGLQDRICAALEEMDGAGRFAEERWLRPE
ncbi:MAG: coproporphyrinogen III oxidase, partial [Synechococcus sp. SB0665_bin_28]|nr:coproporphyrinogen III oxidase [Synechococcus sp. SB0665_bin_28]